MISDPMTVRVLDGLRKQRNLCDYDGELITNAMLDECLAQARQLLDLARTAVPPAPTSMSMDIAPKHQRAYTVHPLNAHNFPIPMASNDEAHFRVMRLIQAKPHLSQRELAQELGVSLGKANYCLQALVQKGLVKMGNFKSNDNKLAYSYLLTPSGIDEKARLTVSFLKHKLAEYVAIRNEIDELQREVAKEARA